MYRSQRDLLIEHVTCYRSQFPVHLTYAITVRKAQGMTVPKVVLNFSQGRKDMGIFYVAASRVRRLEDLMFEESFDYERINGGETELAVMRRADWERRTTQRLTAMNQAISLESRRRGPPRLSQAVTQHAVQSAPHNVSQSHQQLRDTYVVVPSPTFVSSARCAHTLSPVAHRCTSVGLQACRGLSPMGPPQVCSWRLDICLK
jgi:hypothetical protein